jgi:hypothetical protein
MTYQNKHKSKHRLIILAPTLALIFALLAFYAPKYLAYADSPVKSDAVVLIIGPDFNAREKEAKKLINEGYVQYLLIPAYGKVKVIKISSTSIGSENIHRKSKQTFKTISGDSTKGSETLSHKAKPVFENTHLEILMAKKMMAEYKLKSAIFVSSPYHMRRIKFVAESVFNQDEKYVLTFIPTQFEKVPNNLLDLSKYIYRSIILEYLKISVFLAYSYLGE